MPIAPANPDSMRLVPTPLGLAGNAQEIAERRNRRRH